MDKKIAGLLGAAAALTTMSAAQSAVAEPTRNTPPTSYRDLLEPVPDALNALKIDDARIAAAKIPSRRPRRGMNRQNASEALKLG